MVMVVCVGRRSAVDHQTQQFRAAVVSAGVHLRFALIDQREVEISDDLAFSGNYWFPDQFAQWRDDRRERACRDRADRASGIRDDLSLLVGIEPAGGVDDEAAGFECVIADADLRLLGKKWSTERPGPHRGVNLLPVGDQRVPEERVVVLPARQLADSSDGAVDDLQTRRVALTPENLLVIGRRELAAPLKQRAVGVEQAVVCCTACRRHAR